MSIKGRPELYNVTFFPHPVEQGKKMRFIKEKYGLKGYAVWYQILEELGKTDNHFIDLRDETTLMITSSQLSVTENELLCVLNDLARLNAINKELFIEHHVVFSEKFNNSLSRVYERRKNKCMTLSDLCKHLSIKCSQKSTYCSIPSDINTQSKVKESKVKENTKRKTLNKEDYLNSLSVFRSEVDKDWLADLSEEYPDLDIKKSLAKIYDYWVTDEGYQRKIKTKTKNINWRATFKNGLNQEWNQIIKRNFE